MKMKASHKHPKQLPWVDQDLEETAFASSTRPHCHHGLNFHRPLMESGAVSLCVKRGGLQTEEEEGDCRPHCCVLAYFQHTRFLIRMTFTFTAPRGQCKFPNLESWLEQKVG